MKDLILEQSASVRPRRLASGDVIGVCTPSWPAHTVFREKYLHGLNQLRELGFRVREGRPTSQATHEGYRSGKPQERAEELMDLFEDLLYFIKRENRALFAGVLPAHARGPTVRPARLRRAARVGRRWRRPGGVGIREHLMDQRGFADLPRPGNNVQKAPRLRQQCLEYRSVCPLERRTLNRACS